MTRITDKIPPPGGEDATQAEREAAETRIAADLATDRLQNSGLIRNIANQAAKKDAENS